VSAFLRIERAPAYASRMSFRDLAGRVLCAGFPGREGGALPPEIQSRLDRDALGGIILFKRNLGALAETAGLIDRANQYARSAGTASPLIAIDQEGGRVARLGAPFLKLPPMRQLGERDDLTLTTQCARVLGQQLAQLGITLDFAPVMDIDTNPANPVIGDRSFGRTPEVVTAHALAFARGLAQAGVASCAKHFPGHGDTDLDSHFALPRIAHDRARLDAVELAPFRACKGAIPSIMTAHVLFDALDKDVPATLSKRVITGLLREELGYDGVIVSDDLEMKAVAAHWGIADSAVRAIEAGCDLLLVCSSLTELDAAESALAHRAETNEAFRARLEEAAGRVLAMRKRYPVRARAMDWERSISTEESIGLEVLLGTRPSN
jgi:beta-N-acetylhexosaminidase